MSQSIMASHRPPNGGPRIVAPALWTLGDKPGHLLAPEERRGLAAIATIVRCRKGQTIYREGDCAKFVYNIIGGVVKSYKKLPEGGRHIINFLFPDDLFGLAENGRYVNSAEAVTPVSLYRIAAPELEVRLHSRPELDFQIIARLCHDVSEAQRHAFLLSRHRAISKIALFTRMIEARETARNGVTDEIYLPMARYDIAAYVGMTPEAVSRAFRDLAASGAIAFRDRRHLKIIDGAILDAVISETSVPE